MTVCIAAQSGRMLVLASDRMLTGGDIQFEPAAPKTFFITNSIAVQFSGHSAFHAEVMGELQIVTNERVEREPKRWLTVQEVADLYVELRSQAKAKRAAAALLSPLGLTLETFTVRQAAMAPALVESLARDLVNFAVPEVHVIVSGIDDRAGYPRPHIICIHNGHQSVHNSVGFAAVGSGSRHAETLFMLQRYTPKVDLPEALLTVYSAKRDAEIAPGVGSETDIYFIGPQLGVNTALLDEHSEKLYEIYRDLTAKQLELRNAANKDLVHYVQSLAVPETKEQAKPSSDERAAAADAERGAIKFAD